MENLPVHWHIGKYHAEPVDHITVDDDIAEMFKKKGAEFMKTSTGGYVVHKISGKSTKPSRANPKTGRSSITGIAFKMPRKHRLAGFAANDYTRAAYGIQQTKTTSKTTSPGRKKGSADLIKVTINGQEVTGTQEDLRVLLKI